MRCASLAAALLLAGCVAPRDAFVRAERSLLAQDLPGALVAFDAVPVSHDRYPEARAAALTVERRMRRSHELLLEALLLRGEWRDVDALQALERAQAIWPRMPGVDSLIEATEHRIRMLRESAIVDRGDGAEVDTASPVPVPMLTGAVPAAPMGESARPPTMSPPVELAGPGAFAADPMTSGEDPVALGLVAVETRLGRGDLEAAVADLIELSRRFPKDTRVRLRLARVLHQRALQRYGHGQLSAAIVDWERVVVLDPSNVVAKELLATARAEAGPRAPKR